MGELAVLLDHAAAHHGLVHEGEGAVLGFDRARLQRLVAGGVLVFEGHQSYRVAGAPVTWEQRVKLGVWGAGPQALASHRTSASLWSLAGSRRSIVEVLAPYGQGWDTSPARVHETRHLMPVDVAELRGIPCTSIERTIIDCARFGPWERTQEYLDDAVRQRLTTYDGVAGRLLEMPTRGRKGVTDLKALLDVRVGEPIETKSAFETLMAALLRSSHLPPPVRQHAVDIGGKRYYLDFAWPEFMVAVECDSMLAHAAPGAFARDLERQNELLEAGWHLRRFLRRAVKDTPRETLGRIERALVAGGLGRAQR